MAWRELRYVHLTGALLLVASLTGCTIVPKEESLTVASTKNVGQLAQKGERVQGEDCLRKILLIPVTWRTPWPPDLGRAIDNALEKADGDVLLEAVVSWWHIATFPYLETCYIVDGYAARAELGKQK